MNSQNTSVACHRSAPHFSASGLFSGLTSFAELERRIANLSTVQERGDAFEVFAEAYLATQPIRGAAEVWPGNTAPNAVLKQLGLPFADMGVDGVYRTNDEVLIPYQVKFRSGRLKLRWGTELSTFMGLTDQAEHRVLLTNSDDLPEVMNERNAFSCTRGTDLDSLVEGDFEIIDGWLRGNLVKPKVKSPRPHQAEALAAILKGLEDHDRVTSVMACGTGKTLTALWLAERLDARRILVLVPSLALIRQTLHEWLKETSWERPRFRAVCSDPTVKQKVEDEIVVHQSDLDFKVNTNPDDVRTFLSEKVEGVQIVFSTYQSAHVVGEAMEGLPAFDLGIFDEAHKTAGREGARFGFALEDKNLPIAKRVFMTATPRHYDVRKKDKEGDKKLVYSMDVPETYGPIAHTLSFTEAAERDIICNYKVIISVVTSDMINDDVLKRGEVLIDGDPVKARSVANQIALQMACEEHDLRKVFSFHRSVASARDFAGKTASSIKTHLPDYEALHVNGAMPTARREKVMQAFREADRAVISNARCLTEGVDVPAVDVVAFLSPRKSKVDIVQATGRAMRKAEGKECGYLLLPLFLEAETGETTEEALERTGFEEAWNVLQAMQEQDATLAEIIREMREERGRAGGFDDSRLTERVEVLGPEVSLEDLQRAISATIVDRLGNSWDEMFGQLMAFKEEHGHCDVPDKWSENPALGSWVGRQRSGRSKLSPDRVERLEALGFEWNPLSAQWENMFSELVRYEKIHGDCNVQRGWSQGPQLAAWVDTQRSRRSKLSPERAERLEALGFEWDPRAALWERKFSELTQFKEEHGHCIVPIGWSENPELGIWVGEQRTRYNRSKLSPDRVEQLEALGFEWEPFAATWENMFSALVRYNEVHRDCNVPRDGEDPKLGSWVNTQRAFYRRGKLSSDRAKRLEALGIEWDPIAALWEKMFFELVRFKEEHGHCNVPDKWDENPQLGTWVSVQRREFKRGAISPDRAKRLEALGIEWDPIAASWEKMFFELVRFKEEHGHCDVPDKWSENPQLRTWVSVRRREFKRGAISPDRAERLEALGFEWDPRAALWEKMFFELVRFKDEHGHCDVPRGGKNPALGTWVSSQRTRGKKGTMPEERRRRLEEIGFRF